MKLKRGFATVAATVAIGAATAIPALATVTNVGGGTWNWGVIDFGWGSN